MTNTSRNKLPIFIAGIGVVTASMLLLSCNNPNPKGQSAAVENRSDAKANGKAAAADNDLTLPALNALFFEDDFEADLKSKVQLSAQQLQQLKDTASAAVSDLNEDDANGTKSYREAVKQASTTITAILGQEKAGQFYNYIAQRYAAGNDNALPAEPNNVPSDTRIVVNAPAFRMDVFQGGKLVKTYRVGIGYPEFPLPVGVRKAENIIFNPTWTPPDEPWVKGKVAAGKKVAAGSKLNPLGPIKIPIGLPSLIHGGKAIAKLGNFASHGCVGLTDGQVQDFTGLLSQIAGAPISRDSIMGFEKSKTQTKTVKLTQPVLVELRYETIVAENGSLQIYRDVYERGTNTIENATRVLGVYGVKYESLSAAEKEALSSALNAMNRDAKGAVIAGSNSGANDTLTAGEKSKDATDTKDRAKKGKVTRSVEGQKALAVAIAGLKGKGYPAPVSYDTGATATAAK